jgi:ATP-dependent RNA helicase DHX37/DHR1
VTPQPMGSDVPAILHTLSSLRDDPPPWICYGEIVATPKVQAIRIATKVNPKWLFALAPAMCNDVDVKEDPPPRYEAERDCVVGFVAPTYGPHRWPLPIEGVPLTGALKAKWFARLLVEGKILVCLLSVR